MVAGTWKNAGGKGKSETSAKKVRDRRSQEGLVGRWREWGGGGNVGGGGGDVLKNFCSE